MVCKIFFVPNSSIFRKSRGEEDGENRQMQSVLLFKQTQKVDISFNPFQPSVLFHIRTSHLFCSAKQMTGFYMNAPLS